MASIGQTISNDIFGTPSVTTTTNAIDSSSSSKSIYIVTGLVAMALIGFFIIVNEG